ncbi:MAG TPA: DUF2007 domain-containing protein [Solirubrobacterales bacterium]|nr:DUF2007 domain-containing protein [Solirubrobacterales bacterium]
MSDDPGGLPPGALACPRCGTRHPPSERFCPACGMPLVQLAGDGEEALTEARRRARKVNPAYVGGQLVKVGWARNQAEAELIQGLLLEEGIPSVQRRMQGFDVPEFLAGGPRDVLVPEAARDRARALLDDADAPSPSEESPLPLGGIGGSPMRLAAWVLAATATATAVVYVLYELAR